MYKSMRILCVDDEKVSLELIKIILNRFGFEVLTVSCAYQAVMLVCTEKPFFMVISDFHMPDINGIELLRLIRDYSPETIRILTSGGLCRDEVAEYVERGDCDYFIAKPLRSSELVKMFYTGLKLWC